VLVSHIGQGFQGISYPVVGCLFAARGTEARFVGMGDFLLRGAAAAVEMIAQKRGSAGKDFDHVLENRGSNELSVFVVKVEPVTVVKQNISNFDTT
jgi:hypothetical protein